MSSTSGASVSENIEDVGGYNDPRPLGMFLCDGITRDVVTGKLSLIGLIGAVVTANVPVRANFAAFATLTNVRESIEFKFIIVDDNDDVIAKMPPEDAWMTLERPKDLMVEAILLGHFGGVEFPKHGSFFVQLWTKKCSIMERRLLVVEPTPPPQEH